MGRSATSSQQQVQHGVFVNIGGVGTLITGTAGIGKSEIALELISRGYTLIGDDAPLFSVSDTGQVIGTCPGLLDGFLEIRDLGILDIRALFGNQAVTGPQQLDLIVELIAEKTTAPTPEEKLAGCQFQKIVCKTSIPGISIATGSFRNLAVLVETAARNHLLKIKGYNPASEFQSRLNSRLAKS